MYMVRRVWWIVLLLVLLLGVVGLGILVMGIMWAHAARVTLPAREVNVRLPLTVVVTNPVGEVVVEAGEAEKVTVTGWAEVKSFPWPALRERKALQRVALHLVEGEDRVEVQVRFPEVKGPQSLSVHLRVTVPRGAALEVHQQVGRVQVRGMLAPLRVEDGVGEVRVSDTTLGPGSDLTVETGSITFDGALPTEGTVTMRVEVGHITLHLPAESTFQLEANVEMGDIVLRRDGRRLTAKGHFATAVGSSPETRLYLKVETGGIKVDVGE